MLLPIGDDNASRRSKPFIVYIIVAINVIVFLLQLSIGEEFIASYGAIPYEITTGEDLVRDVLVGRTEIVQAPGPTPIYLTIFTSIFMHGGWLHIIGNMLYLWIFGDNIEDNFGHVKFLIFYLLCGVIASFSQILIDPTSVIPMVGASGAIAGVLGSYLIMFPHNRIRVITLWFIITTFELPALVVLGFWVVHQIISQYMASANTSMAQGGVAYMAHIGGFVAGVILTFIFRRRQKPVDPYERDWR